MVAFVDAEVVPEPGWLDHLLRHLADEAVAAVAPRIVPTGGGGALGRLRGRPGRRSIWARPRPPCGRAARCRTSRPPPWSCAGRRSRTVDGFDGALRYGEDVDLVWRLVAAGWTVRYDPSVTATHPVRADARGWLRQRFAYGSSAGPLAVRHGAAVAPVRLSGWSGAAWGLVAVGHPVLGVAVAAGSTAALARKLSALDHPTEEALRLAGRGHLFAGAMVAQAVRRAWLPAALGAAVVSRRVRPAVAVAVLGPPLLEAARRRSPGHAVLRLADDAAYCAGVWAGSWRARTGRALLPATTGRETERRTGRSDPAA